MALFRKVNTEKYVGGRGHAAGPARSEKRRGGRIRTSALGCEFGRVLDLSSTGVRVHSKKRPAVEVGQSHTLTLTAVDETLAVRAKCVWLRVVNTDEFEMGWELLNVDVGKRKKLLELAATAQATDGLSRGWSPMSWWKQAG
jgi:hypothetical protein